MELNRHYSKFNGNFSWRIHYYDSPQKHYLQVSHQKGSLQLRKKIALHTSCISRKTISSSRFSESKQTNKIKSSKSPLINTFINHKKRGNMSLTSLVCLMAIFPPRSVLLLQPILVQLTSLHRIVDQLAYLAMLAKAKS